MYVGNAVQVGGDTDALLSQHLQGDAPQNAQGRCQAAGKMPAARLILKTVVLYVGGIVGMAGAGQVF